MDTNHLSPISMATREYKSGNTSGGCSQTAVNVLLTGAVCFVAAGILATALVLGVWLDGKNVKTLNGAPPLGGEITLVAGDGMAVLASTPLGHEVTLENIGVHSNLAGPGISVDSPIGASTITNTGVLSVAAGNAGITVTPAATGAVVVTNAGVLSVAVTGAGLSVNASTGATSFANTGVTSVVAGTAISVSGATGAVTINNIGVTAFAVTGGGGTANASTGSVLLTLPNSVRTINTLAPTSPAGDFTVAATDGLSATSTGTSVTLADVLTTQTALAPSNANGPTVSYEVAIGFFTTMPENTWRVGPVAGFTNPWFPGAMGDGGQGNTAGGTGWQVPAVGMYTITADCELVPLLVVANDHQSFTVVLALAAITEDPLGGGSIIPAGGYATLDISAGTNGATAPAYTRRLAFSTTFHAGCTGCAIAVADALTVHARMDHTGIGAATTADVYCRLQVARLK